MLGQPANPVMNNQHLFNLLPVEIWGIIATYLSIEDFINLTATCSILRLSLARQPSLLYPAYIESFRFYQKVYMSDDDESGDVSFFYSLCHCCIDGLQQVHVRQLFSFRLHEEVAHILKILIKRRVLDLNLLTSCRDMFLASIIESDDPEVLDELIEGTSIQVSDVFSRASCSGSYRILEHIIDNDYLFTCCDDCTKEEVGNTLVHLLESHDHAQALGVLIDALGGDITPIDGFNDLVGGVFSAGHWESAQVLLEKGVCSLATHGFELLLQSIARDSLPLVELLLRFGKGEIDVSFLDDLALVTATGFGNLEICKLLLQDPRVNPLSSANDAEKVAATPEIRELLANDYRNDAIALLDIYDHSGDPESFAELVSSFLNDHRFDFDGISLMLAAYERKNEAVEILMENDEFGCFSLVQKDMLPLYMVEAVKSGCPEAVKYILSLSDDHQYCHDILVDILDDIYHDGSFNNLQEYWEDAGIDIDQVLYGLIRRDNINAAKELMECYIFNDGRYRIPSILSYAISSGACKIADLLFVLTEGRCCSDTDNLSEILLKLMEDGRFADIVDVLLNTGKFELTKVLFLDYEHDGSHSWNLVLDVNGSCREIIFNGASASLALNSLDL